MRHTARLSIAVLLAGRFALASAAEPAKAPRRWKMDSFLISHWSFPKEGPRLKQFAEAGFNTVIAVPEELPACQAKGWRALLAVRAEEVPAYVHNPIVWGYFLLDEPARKNIRYETLVPTMEAFHRLDPSRPAYINLNEKDDPQAFVKLLRPRVLSYDYYQWWSGSEPFFPLLERFRRAALDADLPLLCWVEAVAVPHGPAPADNEARVRQSVYAALAYGAKGIQWWGWRADSPDCAKINGELKVLGPELVKLRSGDVFHTAPLPPQTRPVPGHAWVQSSTAGLVLGLFRNEEGTDFLLLANRDWKTARTATLTFAVPVMRVSRFDRQTGRWIDTTLALENDRPTLAQRLAPGDGVLLRVAKEMSVWLPRQELPDRQVSCDSPRLVSPN